MNPSLPYPGSAPYVLPKLGCRAFSVSPFWGREISVCFSRQHGYSEESMALQGRSFWPVSISRLRKRDSFPSAPRSHHGFKALAQEVKQVRERGTDRFGQSPSLKAVRGTLPQTSAFPTSSATRLSFSLPFPQAFKSPPREPVQPMKPTSKDVRNQPRSTKTVYQRGQSPSP